MKSQRPLETVSIYILLAIIGISIADIGILMFRDLMLPMAPPAIQRRPSITRPMTPDRSAYNTITARNIFNSDQVIPDPVGADPTEPELPSAEPVPTSLPLQLVGTIVHVNPERSVATIQLKQKNEQVPFRVNDVIPDNLATVTKIERNKVIFRNNVTQNLEYVELKEEARISFGAASLSAPLQNGEVLQRSENEYELKRNDINRLTNNLAELLQQARAVPRMGPNGQIECFNIADMQPGSIYEKLGLRRGDCIKTVNGERIDSPAKAMELYNALRASASSVNLGVERSGRDEEFRYNITN